MSTEQKEANDSFGWGIHETEVKKMSLGETQDKYEAKHQWLCNGVVLKLEDPKSKHNSALFKVNTDLSFNSLISTTILFSDGLEKMSACDSVGNR